jgi:hypothetical protein
MILGEPTLIDTTATYFKAFQHSHSLCLLKKIEAAFDLQEAKSSREWLC